MAGGELGGNPSTLEQLRQLCVVQSDAVNASLSGPVGSSNPQYKLIH
jgi:hypothetical protein